jgi:putative FmdB family regulatory protein
MPVYEYRCPACRATFELLRPMSRAEEPAPCPKGHAAAERVVSLVAAPSRGEGPAAKAATGCACGGACACGH